MKKSKKKVIKWSDNPQSTPSKSSPKGGKRGCLCADNTYHVDCCDGTLRAQGIGKG